MIRTLTALALALLGINAGLAVAHVLEAPNKWKITPETWLAVQRDLYDGWGTWIPAIELVAMVAVGVLAWQSRGTVRWLFVAAIVSIVVSEAIIWPIWVLPTNQAVDAWTGPDVMANWQALRLSWEGGHAARTVVLVVGLLAATWAGVDQQTAER